MVYLNFLSFTGTTRRIVWVCICLSVNWHLIVNHIQGWKQETEMWVVVHDHKAWYCTFLSSMIFLSHNGSHKSISLGVGSVNASRSMQMQSSSQKYVYTCGVYWCIYVRWMWLSEAYLFWQLWFFAAVSSLLLVTFHFTLGICPSNTRGNLNDRDFTCFSLSTFVWTSLSPVDTWKCECVWRYQCSNMMDDDILHPHFYRFFFFLPFYQKWNKSAFVTISLCPHTSTYSHSHTRTFTQILFPVNVHYIKSSAHFIFLMVCFLLYRTQSVLWFRFL